MRLYRLVEAIVLRFINFVWLCFIRLHENKNIKAKKSLYTKSDLTEEQKSQIDRFYIENYGKKIPYKWHRLYQSYTGKFDFRYIPEPLFTTALELIDNRRIEVLPLENKVVLTNFVRGNEDKVRVPKTYIACVAGRFYDGNLNPIDQGAAIALLTELNGGTYDAICKKTLDTSSGRDVRLVKIKDGIDQVKNDSIEDILKSMGSDFIVQEKIVAHRDISALYDKSINTIRVLTYQTKYAYKAAPVVMRIGRDSYLDNAHAGGMFVGVTDDGALLKEAFTEYQDRYTVHPVSGVEFDGYVIPRIPDVIDAAIQMHKNYPTVRFMSWDFAIDENENIVVIEVNLHSQSVWLSQTAHGCGVFREDTAEMLHLIAKSNR
ncbi:MAG: hypothetical protein IKA64_05920 [Clostridia bacterium]|nr:hypothetical protein [Clostridia bacterium]